MDDDFLQRMSKIDAIVEHPDAMDDSGTCGECANLICMAEAARKLIKDGVTKDAVERWERLTSVSWKNSKYFRLYQEAVELGKDPYDAFKEKGWQL